MSKISALKKSTEPVEHREGGNPSRKTNSPGLTKFEPITLERGVTHDLAFEEWANRINQYEAGDGAMSLATYKQDIRIELLNLQGTPVKSYNVFNCWVSEYTALPELDAGANAVAIESMVLQNEGWERDTSFTEPTQT